jgi:hypothetical protein
VELGVNYVLIISTNAGLWGYNIGDTVQFTSLKPYRIIVSGRIKHIFGRTRDWEGSGMCFKGSNGGNKAGK